ncbi:MAG: hypothetical protein ACKVJP_05690 [Flavobacteriales bacterium]
MKLNILKRIFLFGLSFCFFLVSCMSSGKLPKGESFKYEEGEIVYYKVDHHPMLIEKQVVKKGTKYYKVIFKNKDGELMENEISEEELLSSPPANRAKI